MTRRLMFKGLAVVLALASGLVLTAPALADSVATEQQQGAQILSQVQHGKLGPKTLTNDQYENVGEYLMGQALGSTQLHGRMNTLMDEMMGASASDLMHIYLGKRYLGVTATRDSRYGALYGLMGSMMSGYQGSPLATMMSRYLTGQPVTTGSYAVGSGMMAYGPGMMGYAHRSAPAVGSTGDSSTAAIVGAAALGALVIAGALALAVPRIRRRSRPTTPAASVH